MSGECVFENTRELVFQFRDFSRYDSVEDQLKWRDLKYPELFEGKKLLFFDG